MKPRRTRTRSAPVQDELLQTLLKDTTDGVLVADPEGRLVEANARACVLLGYRRTGLLGRPVEHLIPADERPTHPLCPDAPRGTRTRHGTGRLCRKDGTTVTVQVTARRLSDGRLVGVLRHQPEDRPPDGGDRPSHPPHSAGILDLVYDSIIITDLEGCVTSWNQGAVQHFGYAANEAVGRHISFLYPDEQQQFLKDHVIAPLKQKGRHKTDVRVRTKSGADLDLHLSLSLLRNHQGTPIGMIGLSIDLTARKRAEQALRESEERSRLLIEHAPYCIHEIDSDGRICSMNPAGLRMIGLNSSSTIVGTPYLNGVASQDRPRIEVLLHRAFGGDRSQFEFTSVQGKTYRSNFVPLPGPDGAGKRVMGISVDITDRRRAEQALRASEERLREAQRLSQVGSWDLDLVRNQLLWSDEIYRIFEIDPDRFGASYEAFLATVHPDDRALVDETYTASVRHRTPYEVTHRLQMPDGRIKFVHELGRTEYGPDGTPLRSIGTVQDITERKRAQDQIEASLREKETLLREVHHRVKNNLQIISSLLHFQSKKIHDPVDLAAFQEGQARLKTMILVHEKLYQSADLARINFGDYVRSLAGSVVRNYSTPRKRFRLSVEASDLRLPIETALPCGMILNELLTNSCKYAYPDAADGLITVSLSVRGGQATLTVRDRGIGLPAEVDPSHPTTFGLQLVVNLSAQVGGTSTFVGSPGTTAAVTFPLPARTTVDAP